MTRPYPYTELMFRRWSLLACLLVGAHGLVSKQSPFAFITSVGKSSREIASVRANMQQSANSSAAQKSGCAQLQRIADTQREGPGPYGGRRVSTALLRSGIGEAALYGLENAVAVDVAAGRASPSPEALMCLSALQGLTVQNDYDKSVALIKSAPRLWEGITKYMKAFPHSQEVRNNMCIFAGLLGSPTPPVAAIAEVKAGAVDWLMGHFKDASIKSDPELFQKVWCGLSDTVHGRNEAVARAMVNYGGHLQGIPVLVNALRMCRESKSTFHEGNGFGLLYEGVHVLGGVLMHDDEDKTAAHEFIRLGMVRDMVPIMETEPGDNLLQDMSCEVIKRLSDASAGARTELAAAGAMEAMAKALVKFTNPPRHGYGMVVGTCSAALLNFAKEGSEWQDKLLSLGVADALNDRVLAEYPRERFDEFELRAVFFPNTNIYALKDVLEKRKARRAAAASKT